MNSLLHKTSVLTALIAASVVLGHPAATSHARADDRDWPMYNCDVIGTRYNRGETAISRNNASRLEEKWRFPAAGSDLEVGVIHATPVVVNGCVYFGTGSTLFIPLDFEAYFPKKFTGVLYSFGLPGEDEVHRMGAGKE